MVKLSKRMQAVASMVTAGSRLADVGTDHGYVPIALVQKGKIPSAIALDINAGPLQRASENIREAGLTDKIRTALGDGVAPLAPGEADTILIAGMGGELVIHILTEGEAVCRAAHELVLQPQSEIRKVRKYLRTHGYRIEDEDMIYEEGKYYPMMRVEPVERVSVYDNLEAKVVTACDIYGPLLLKNGNPVLRRYLVKEYKNLSEIRRSLMQQEQTENITRRIEELDEKIRYNESAYTILGEIANAGL